MGWSSICIGGTEAGGSINIVSTGGSINARNVKCGGSLCMTTISNDVSAEQRDAAFGLMCRKRPHSESPPPLPVKEPATIAENPEGVPSNAGGSNHRCVVCMEARQECIIMPCHHLCLCSGCSPAFSPATAGPKVCPICRRDITSVDRVFAV